MNDITNKSEFVIKHIYKIYLDNIEDGETPSYSKYFGSCEELQSKYFVGLSFDELHECINELSRQKYLNVAYGSNVPCAIILENKTIVYMENEYSNNVKSILKDLARLKNLLSIF